jgi:basic membrane protein A
LCDAILVANKPQKEKKMKKFVLFLLVAILALSMVGCGQTPAEPEAPVEPVEPVGKVYNVANLVNGNLGDKSFFDAAESGLKELEAAGRITYKSIEMGGTDQDQPKWLETLNEVASSGEYDLIICGTYQMPDYLKEAATTYPDQKFLIYDDNTYVGVNQNVVNITYKQNDMGYLIGTFAGKMTTETSVANMNPEAVVGFVGGIDSPVINDFLYGFLLGAQAANPEIKVDTRYVNSYVDTATAKEMGLSMINDKKADILWGVAGLSGNGAAEAALESGKAWFVGVDSDQELTLPADQAAITLTSGLKNIGQSIVWLFDEWDAGRTYWGQEVRLGISEGGVGIVADKNFAKIAPQAVQDAVLAAQADIVAGKIIVPTAIGDTTNAVVTLRDSLQP